MATATVTMARAEVLPLSIAVAECSSPRVTPHAWRGFGGFTPTVERIEYDKQLDRISVWMELWDHEQRCELLERLLRQTNVQLSQFISSVVEPAMHRDFMYAAATEYPEYKFTPISNYKGRLLKEQHVKNRRKNKPFRKESAHLQTYEQLLDVRQLQKLDTSRSPRNRLMTSSLCSDTRLSLNSARGRDRRCHSIVSMPEFALPSLACSSNDATESPRSPLKDNQSVTPCFRFSDMPVRRHMQNEDLLVSSRLRLLEEPSQASTSSRLKLKEDSLQAITVKNPANTPRQKTNGFSHPSEDQLLAQWYIDCWDDLRRTEFWHKILLKLDPRQLHFIACFLFLQHHRDFLALLPEHIALKILNYLTLKELVVASKVSKVWFRLCHHEELWKKKCAELEIKIPEDDQNDQWQRRLEQAISLEQNWTLGRCKVINCHGHKDRVLSVTFDDTKVATGGRDKVIKLWSLTSGKCVQTLYGHTKGIWCLVFFSKTIIISGSYDCTVRVWNIRSGECVKKLDHHDGPVWALALRGNCLVSVSQDKTAKVWDVGTFRLLHTLRGHHQAIFCVDMDEDGTLIVTGSADKTVRIWDALNGVIKKVVAVSPTTSVMTVSFRRGHFACSYDSVICLYSYDGEKCHLIRTFKEHFQRVESLQLKIKDQKKPEGHIISAGKDAVIKYWNIEKQKSIHTFHGHKKHVNCLFFDEKRIATASYDNEVKIWDFNI